VHATADGLATSEDSIPAHKELDESSHELDDEISLPVPEELEGEPEPLSGAPINEELAKEPFAAPDPAESAAEAQAHRQRQGPDRQDHGMSFKSDPAAGPGVR
jgi:hypothetical protein